MCHAEALQPPQAARQPKQLLTNGDEREDCYYWLRDDDRKAPEVTTRRVMFRVQSLAVLLAWLAAYIPQCRALAPRHVRSKKRENLSPHVIMLPGHRAPGGGDRLLQVGARRHGGAAGDPVQGAARPHPGSCILAPNPDVNNALPASPVPLKWLIRWRCCVKHARHHCRSGTIAATAVFLDVI